MHAKVACMLCMCMCRARARRKVSTIIHASVSRRRGGMRVFWPQLFRMSTGKVALRQFPDQSTNLLGGAMSCMCLSGLSFLPSVSYREYPSTDRGTLGNCRSPGRLVGGPRSPMHRNNFPRARR